MSEADCVVCGVDCVVRGVDRVICEADFVVCGVDRVVNWMDCDGCDRFCSVWSGRVLGEVNRVVNGLYCIFGC